MQRFTGLHTQEKQMVTMRIFVEIPIDSAEPLYPLLGRLKAIYGIKTTSVSQLHITLAFIGENSDVSRIIDSVKKSVSGFQSFDMTICGIGSFDGNGKTDIVWIGAEPSDILNDLAHSIRKGLDDDGIGYDRKPFKAHITLGRSKNSPIPSGSLMKAFDNTMTVHCDSVLIMSSELTANGQIHRIIYKAEFQHCIH